MSNQNKNILVANSIYFRKLQITITIIAISIAIAHVILPNITIDFITLILVVIAIIPWLAPLFKSLEFPGGWKVEFQSLKEAEEKADKAGLLAEKPKVQQPEYSFLLVARQDPNLALAGVRIEIEKRLNRLAEANDIRVERYSMGQLLRLLSKNEVITNSESQALADIADILNSAVHGASVDGDTAELAIDIGSRLLKTFDEKIENSKVKK